MRETVDKQAERLSRESEERQRLNSRRWLCSRESPGAATVFAPDPEGGVGYRCKTVQPVWGLPPYKWINNYSTTCQQSEINRNTTREVGSNMPCRQLAQCTAVFRHKSGKKVLTISETTLFLIEFFVVLEQSHGHKPLRTGHLTHVQSFVMSQRRWYRHGDVPRSLRYMVTRTGERENSSRLTCSDNH